MISRTDLALANAVVHENLNLYLQQIYIGCERCGCPQMFVISHEPQKPRIEGLEDIILEVRYFLKCPNCGFEEADCILTIIPSWQWHPMREKMPKSGKELFKEKIELARAWWKK